MTVSARTCSILIFALSFLMYANTLNHGFVLDDFAVIGGNEYVKHGIGGMPEIFTTGSWSGYDPERDLHIYRPLQLAVLALQYEIFGLHPFGYHLIHVLSYALLCLLCFELLGKLLQSHPSGRILAFLAVLLFTIHPIHTEVVANVKGNGDLLSMLFSILSLRLAWSYGQEQHPLQLLGATTLLFIALLFKETAASTVGIAALVLYFFSDLRYRSIGLALLPMLTAVLAYLLIRNQVFGEGAHSLETTTSDLSNVILMADGWSQEIGLRLYALGKNLQLLLFPYPLLMMYVYDSVPMVEAYEMESLFPLLIYCIIGIVFIWELRKRSVLGFSLGLFLVSLFLFSNILFSIPNIVSERWLLMPSLGICLLMAILWQWLWQQNRTNAFIVLGVVCIGYSGYTLQRNADWQSNLSLGRADIKTAPSNFNVMRMMATELFFAANAKEKKHTELLRESAYYFEQMLRITPDDYINRNNLGVIYEELGQHERAALEFAEVMRHDSDIKEKAKYSYAKNQVLAGNYSQALTILDKLKTNYPAHTGIKELRATALKGIDKETAALSIFSELLTQEPSHAKANQHFAEYYLELAKANALNEDLLARSAQHHERWLMTTENNLPGHNTLGQIYERLGKYKDAAKHFTAAASQPSPIRGKAAFSAAKNMALSDMHKEAYEAWQELESDYPNVPEVAFAKAQALVELEKPELAAQAYRRTIEIIKGMDSEQALKQKETLTNAEAALRSP